MDNDIQKQCTVITVKVVNWLIFSVHQLIFSVKLMTGGNSCSVDTVNFQCKQCNLSIYREPGNSKVNLECLLRFTANFILVGTFPCTSMTCNYVSVTCRW